MATEPLITETDSRFPSGEWVGFYMQHSVARDRHRMDLCLTFQSGSFIPHVEPSPLGASPADR